MKHNEHLEVGLNSLKKNTELQKVLNDFKCECSDFGNSNSNRRGQSGGGMVSFNTLRRIIFFMATALAAWSLSHGGVGVQGITVGITALFNGECNSFNNMVFGMIGLGNPVCAVYQRFMASLSGAIMGSTESIALLTGMATMVIGAPYGIYRALNNFTYAIANVLPESIIDRTELIQPRLGNGNQLALGNKKKSKKGKKSKKKSKKGKKSKKRSKARR
jgi:hypothetical protein